MRGGERQRGERQWMGTVTGRDGGGGSGADLFFHLPVSDIGPFVLHQILCYLLLTLFPPLLPSLSSDRTTLGTDWLHWDFQLY